MKEGVQEEQKQTVVALLEAIAERLDRMEERLGLSVVKESYTVEEVAERLNRAEYTVRQWCNKGQAQAKKVRGRGRQGEWRISHDELVRLQNDGPMPLGTFNNHGPGLGRLAS